MHPSRQQKLEERLTALRAAVQESAAAKMLEEVIRSDIAVLMKDDTEFKAPFASVSFAETERTTFKWKEYLAKYPARKRLMSPFLETSRNRVLRVTFKA